MLSVIVLAAACGGEVTPPTDGGGGGLDSTVPRDSTVPPRPDSGPVTCASDTDCPETYCNPGTRVCCRPADPPYDICGDRIDQNCNRRDTSCGDNDADGAQACRPGEDPTAGGCDCDDERSDVRPPFGTLAGAPELCDGVDNDCNGRVDESAECCAACSVLGSARNRADICTVDDVCDCSTEPSSGPCAEGRACCAMGCVDLQTDAMNCGFCSSACTVSSDRCVAGNCRCGDGPPCDLDTPCVSGSCG
ncbi:MAG: putative metal-binding motif-containing protein [Sandaracinaceae bacterium]|nr:putative metal-binding motif-containing protein [Sandaracinaceae bacterium]